MDTDERFYHTSCIPTVLNERAQQSSQNRRFTLMTTVRAKVDQTCHHCTQAIPFGDYCVQLSAWDSPSQVS